MKVSDFVVKYLEEIGTRHVFLLAGGGMMHLLDSVSRSTKIEKIYNFNEQATTICGDGYAQYTNDMSVCMLTTGPGCTNAVTGVVSAYQDSTPMLIISGQVKTSDLSPNGVRVYGPQEVNIVEIVKSVTKYAITVKNPKEIRYHLERAVYEANHGRRGPVWIDIPLDVQGADVEIDDLKTYEPEENDFQIYDTSINNIIQLLKKSRKPVFLFGHGVIASNAQELAREIVELSNIPALTTWRAKELFDFDNRLFFGSPGSQAPRYSNFILQNADVLIVIGSRLDWSLTAYDEPQFAKNAKKIIVDIESAEMDKLNMVFEEKIKSDAKTFLLILKENIKDIVTAREEWIGKCKYWKELYPIEDERPVNESELVYGYDFANELNKFTNNKDVMVASPTGRVCIAMNLGIKLKDGQKFVAPRGLGSMGYALPCSIAACIASGKRRTICFEGDGSLQHNIQELQLLKNYKLPIKLFIYNNGGYSSIYGMQKNHFNGNLAGCTPDSGIQMPDIKNIANAYEIPYKLIKNTRELSSGIKDALKDDDMLICEVIGDISYEELPRTQTKVDKDGKITSSSLENLYPFIDDIS